MELVIRCTRTAFYTQYISGANCSCRWPFARIFSADSVDIRYTSCMSFCLTFFRWSYMLDRFFTVWLNEIVVVRLIWIYDCTCPLKCWIGICRKPWKSAQINQYTEDDFERNRKTWNDWSRELVLLGYNLGEGSAIHQNDDDQCPKLRILWRFLATNSTWLWCNGIWVSKYLAIFRSRTLLRVFHVQEFVIKTRHFICFGLRNSIDVYNVCLIDKNGK